MSDNSRAVGQPPVTWPMVLVALATFALGLSLNRSGGDVVQLPAAPANTLPSSTIYKNTEDAPGVAAHAAPAHVAPAAAHTVVVEKPCNCPRAPAVEAPPAAASALPIAPSPSSSPAAVPGLHAFSHARRAPIYSHLWDKYLLPERGAARVLLLNGACDEGIQYPSLAGQFLSALQLAHVTVLEHNSTCVAYLQKEAPAVFGAAASRLTVVQGQPSNVAHLEEAIRVAGGSSGAVDAIVSTGESIHHSMAAQLLAFRTLLPRLQPGGAYFQGAIRSSFHRPDLQDSPIGITTAGYMTALREVITKPESPAAGVPDVLSLGPTIKGVECAEDMCVVIKYTSVELSTTAESVHATIPALNANWPRNPTQSCPSDPVPSIWALGLKSGTDKVRGSGANWHHRSSHHYDVTYQKYLGMVVPPGSETPVLTPASPLGRPVDPAEGTPVRCKDLHFLEIGLGCGMHYGPGHSMPLWRDFLPNAYITSMEFNVECANKFLAEDPFHLGDTYGRDAPGGEKSGNTGWRRFSLYTGDQSKATDLMAVQQAAGPFDIICDDGGHSMVQQITSLRTLFPLVKPGGWYHLEDFHTSWEGYTQDGPGGVTTTQYLSETLRMLNSRDPYTGAVSPAAAASLDPVKFPGAADLATHIKSVDCSEEICTFFSWRKGEQEAARARAAGVDLPAAQ